MTRLPQPSIGIVGATGAVGEEMLAVLAKRKFPARQVRLFASARSAGKQVDTPFGSLLIEAFSPEAAMEVDILLLAVSGDFAREHAPALAAAKGGPIIIDNSSAFRMHPDIPLVCPPVNAAAARGARLIANPNCTTLIAALVLAPLHAEAGLRRVIVSTYQAASGAGAAGMAELRAESARVLDGKQADCQHFAHPLAFNLIPHIDSFENNGYTREEMKVTLETRKIFGLPEDVRIACTAVRVPTFRAHAESLALEFDRPLSPTRARELLASAPGVRLVDSPNENAYPMPLSATHSFDVEVGRIRQSLAFGENGLELFVCGDQLLRGAALNAVEIAELFLEQNG